MSLITRVRVWLGHKLLNMQAGARMPWHPMEMSDTHTSALECADMCNGRIVILYDTDAGTGIRYLGMGKQDMLIKLRGRADAIDLADADLMGRH